LPDQEAKVKIRDSNLELLRIFAMFLIICHHFAVHSGVLSLSPYPQNRLLINVNLIWSIFLSYGGKIGVDVFVLITGYFLIRSVPKFSSLIRIIITTVFYSVSIYLIFCFIGKEQLSLEHFFTVLFPIASKQYWFVNAYVLLFIFAPFLSYGLRAMAEPDSVGFYRYIILLAIITFFWCLLQSLPIKINNYYCNSFLWFIVLFIFASFIRIFEYKINTIPTKALIIFSLILLSLLLAVAVISNEIGGFWNNYRKRLMQQNSVLIFGLSLTIFVFFRRLKIGTIPWINKISATTFGIYLIHDNHFVRDWLWGDRVHVVKHIKDSDYIIWSLLVILLIFIICSIIDHIKYKTFDKLINVFIIKLKPIDRKIKYIFSE
jgi:surface polysaccharide O-acyltransferase-like enzyme